MHVTASTVYEFGEFRLDAGKRLLFRRESGEVLPLTPKVFETLLCFVRQSGIVITKDELMEAVWADTIVEENNLSQNISTLRRALGEKRGEHRFIATVPGKGFKFVAQVEEIRETRNDLKIDPVALDPLAVVANSVTPVAQSNLEPSVNGQQKNFFWILATAGAVVVGLCLVGFYTWRENKKFVDAPIKTIAVLPFKPLVAGNRDESLEMGMADTLIARLGDSREIVVRPFSSVRKFGGLEQDALAAGHALDADSVLDGNIQRWGDTVRVNVRLLKTKDGTALWTGTFDEKFTDIFRVQDAISKKVAAALALQLTGGDQTKLEKRYTNNAEAYEFYLRGRFHYFKITQPDIRKSIGFYQQAIEIDPNYALAWAALADAYRTLPIAGFAPSKEYFPQAKRAALRALEIDDQLAEARVILGWVAFWYDWNWTAAESEFKQAIELAPNNSDAHRAYAHLLSNLGRHTEALAEIKRARELDPLTLITNLLEGQFLFYAGRETEAIARLQKTLEVDPNFWAAYNGLGRIYLHQAHYPEAIVVLQKAKELSNTSEPMTQLGYALAKSGNRTGAQAALAELQSFDVQNYVPAYNFAMIYNGLGEKGEALNYLEKSFQEREVQLTFIKIDTRWNEFRDEPRFAAILKHMNFELSS